MTTSSYGNKVKKLSIPYPLRRDMELINLNKILDSGELRLSTVEVYAFSNIIKDNLKYLEGLFPDDEFTAIYDAVDKFYRSIGSDGGKYFFLYKKDTIYFNQICTALLIFKEYLKIRDSELNHGNHKLTLQQYITSETMLEKLQES